MRRGSALMGAAACLAALTVAGCASGTKSGGKATHQITIVMQTPDAGDEPSAAYFIAQVKARSGGRIQIVEGNDYPSSDPNNEARLGRALQSGRVEMGYLPSRAWERVSSVTAFRALQAPFLVTNYPLLRQITTGPIGRSMLASLGRIGMVGLGLVPDELRRALGRRPLASPADFRGARIRVVTSPTGVLALRSLGAVPLTSFTSSQVGPALQRQRLDGAESSTNSILSNSYVSEAPYVTANLALFAKTQTIAIRKSVFDRLHRADQAVLRAAATATVTHARPSAQERNEVQTLCRQGLRVVKASPSDLASLKRAAASAYPLLERNATTHQEIAAIEQLKRQAGGTAALPACRAQGSSGSGTKNAGLPGTYVMTASQSEVANASGNQPNENWGSFRLVFRGERFRMSDRRPAADRIQGHSSGWSAGTYVIQGDRITLTTLHGAGDAPFGGPANQPVICRWSIYRNALTFQHLSPAAQATATAHGLDPAGPPAIFVKPWQKSGASSSPPRRRASGFPTGVFETKITPSDLRGTVFPSHNAHWETLTFENGTWRDVWFHPRRDDQPPAGGRYVVHGNELTLLPVHDVVRWSYYRGQLTFRIVDVADAFGRFTYTVHAWRRVS